MIPVSCGSLTSCSVPPPDLVKLMPAPLRSLLSVSVPSEASTAAMVCAASVKGAELVWLGSRGVISALLVGVAPAWHASKANIVDALKEGARGSTMRGGRLRGALIVVEVALSVVLLVGSALLLISFLQLQRTAPGFEATGAASAIVGLPVAKYKTPAEQADFFGAERLATFRRHLHFRIEAGHHQE